MNGFNEAVELVGTNTDPDDPTSIAANAHAKSHIVTQIVQRFLGQGKLIVHGDTYHIHE